MMLDPVLLSRLQFAFTVSFHIVFPTMSIGLAAFFVLVEYLYLKPATSCMSASTGSGR